MILYLLATLIVYCGLLAWNPHRFTLMTDFTGVVVGVYHRPLLRRVYIFMVPCIGIRVDLNVRTEK